MSDGKIIFETALDNSGIVKGFRLLNEQFKKETAPIAGAAEKACNQINGAFSKINVSKPIANAAAKVQQLENKLTSITSDFNLAVSEGDDKSAERLAAKRIVAYDRLEAAREKLAIEVEAAAQKQAAAEEKATQKAIKAAEKETAAKAKASEKQLNNLAKPARHFNSRLREIVSGALVFNVISAGLRGVTSYFVSALKANNEFSNSLSLLKGSLMTAFQPIYESVLPALLTMMNWLNTAIQVVGRFFAALSGKSYSQMQKNAQDLNDQAVAISGVGSAAEEAKKQLMGFDEINKLSAQTAASGGGGGGVSAPTFDNVEIPSEWETAIDSLAMRVKDIFFEWENLTPEVVAEKLVTALGLITGGLIGFALGGPTGALIGMTVGAGLGVVLSNIIFNGDGTLSYDELLAALVAGLSIIGGAIIGFALGGPGGALIGATIGLGLTFTILNATFDDVEKNYDDLANKIIEWSDQSARITESGFIMPTYDDILWLKDKISEYFKASSDDIINNFNLAARTTETGFIIPTKEEMAAAAEWISLKFREAKDGVINTWHSTADWFAQNVTEPIVEKFRQMRNNIAKFINGAIQGAADGINSIVSTLNQMSFTVPEWVPGIGGAKMGFNIGYITSYPQIPYLAQGAVLPANKPFLAMVGDQKHGTNIEAPESAIYEQARKAVSDVLGGSDITRIVALLEQIAEKDTAINMDGKKVGEIVAKYQRSQARALGI